MVCGAVQAQDVRQFNEEPQLIKDALYVPISEVSTALEIEVKREKNEVVLTHSNIALRLDIGKSSATLSPGGKTIELPFRTFEVGKEVFASVRVIADAFNLQTSLNDNTLRVGDVTWTLPTHGLIFIDLGSAPQKFFFYEGARPTIAGLVSGAKSIVFLKKGETRYTIKKKLPNGKLKWYEPIHNHYGEFVVDAMYVSRRSDEYNCELPYAFHIEGGHYFHVGPTTGYGASHGCVRRSASQGKLLYDKALPYFKSKAGLKIRIIK
jgi:hypothetical protein